MPAADLRKLERGMFFAIMVAAHVLVLSYLARDRIFAPMAEPPPIVVAMVRPPPPPLRKLEAEEAQSAPTQLHRTPLPIRPHKKKDEDEATVETPSPAPAAPALTAAPPGDAAPGLRTDLKPAPALQPGFRWKLRSDEERVADCEAAWKKLGYPGVAPCSRAGPLPANAYNIDRDSKTGKFTGEARYNDAIRAYKEAPGDAGFPGMRCTLLKKC